MKPSALVLALALFLALSRIALAQAPDPALQQPSPWADSLMRSRVEPALLQRLLQAGADDRIPVVVTMREQSVSAVAAHSSAQRAALVAGLQDVAERSQQDVRAFLDRESAAGHVADVRSFWIFNGLSAWAVPDTVTALAQRSDVEVIRLDHFEKRLDPWQADEAALDVSWGVQRVRADRVWSVFGVTGQGIVVANMDTGVDFLHPDLSANYRGNFGQGIFQHVGNWFDATDGASAYPYDPAGHGTHTMGTLAGQGGIGVAPGAKWIAVRVLDRDGYGYDSWIHAGFQWLLAPAGDPDKAPQVVSNSWGNQDATMQEFAPDLGRLQQAGILAVFSAGNSGPDTGSLSSPASLPGVFSVGATDPDDEVAAFSSRGPSPWGDIKPSIAAPGVNVTSAFPGGGYAYGSGTSMAAPHVAGAAALLMSANRTLSITATVYALTSTARALGTSIPNNDSGWGLLDAYAAAEFVSGAGTISGEIDDALSLLPLSDAVVTAHRDQSTEVVSASTGADGRYSIALPFGAYHLSVYHFGHVSQEMASALVFTGTSVTRDALLERRPYGLLQVMLTDTVRIRPVTATVSALNTPVSQSVAGDGILSLPAGAYTIEVRALGYKVVTATVTITADQLTQHGFGLTPALRVLLVSSGAWYYHDYSSYYRAALDSLGYTYDVRTIKHVLTDTPVITDLLKYDLVIWSSPDDSPGYIGADGALVRYLKGGRKLLLSGQDVAFWDSGASGIMYASYLRDYLKTNFVVDDAPARIVEGVPSSPMAGAIFSIEGGDGANNQRAPDQIARADKDYAAVFLAYGGDPGAEAGIGASLCLPYRSLMLGFGYEGIASPADRQTALARALDFFSAPPPTAGLSLLPLAQPVQIGASGATITFTLRARNTGQGGTAQSYTASVQGPDWQTAISPAHFSLAPCATALVTATVRIPAGLSYNVSRPFTITVRPDARPDLTQFVTMTAKTPAPLLLVDRHRWYDTLPAYRQDLAELGLPYDVVTAYDPETGAMADIGADRLKLYPLVVWYTAYDWYRPMSPQEEAELSEYLDGGGSLMLSSTFYLALNLDRPFARKYLGVIDYTDQITATQVFGSPGSPLRLSSVSLPLTRPYPAGGFPVLSSALLVGPETAAAWRGNPDWPLAISRTPGEGRLVFWAIPFEALPTGPRGAVLGRTLGWLGPLGDSTVQVDPPVVAAGGSATVTLTLHNSGPAIHSSLLVTLPVGVRPDLGTLPPALHYDPGANTLSFTGALGSAAQFGFVFRVVVDDPAPGMRPGTVTVRDEELGLNFDLPLGLGVELSDLSASRIEVNAPGPVSPQQVKMLISNRGLGATGPAQAISLLAWTTDVVTTSVALDGPGAVMTDHSRVTWQGVLAPGESAVVTYAVRSPRTATGPDSPIDMLVWDGSGGSWESRAWLPASPFRRYFPVIP